MKKAKKRLAGAAFGEFSHQAESNSPVQLLTILFASIFMGVIGYAIRPKWGFLVGFLFGPIGWLIAVVLRANDRK